jgi:hypothetical protein
MQVTVIEKTKRYTVSGSQTTKRYEVNSTQSSKRYVLEIAELGKRGYTGLSSYQLAVRNGLFEGTEQEYLLDQVPKLTVLGDYERDWANDFLIALNT